MAGLYTFRLHEQDESTRQQLIEWLKHEDGAVFAVRETEAARPHYQGALRTPTSMQTLRNHMKKAFPWAEGNKDYSIKKATDWEGYVQYLSKGAKHGALPDVVYTHGIEIDEDYIKDKHDAYWAENARLRKKAKETGGKSVVETVIQNLQGRKLDEEKKLTVANEVIKVLKSRGSAVNMYHARGLFNAVMLRIDEGFEQDFALELISKY